MVLLHLLTQNKLNIVVAHCNFGLRGEESNGDEQLVKEYCATHAIPYVVNQFDVKKYIITHKVGVQEAARNLRYHWFTSLCIQYKASYIAVAHNANDQAETIVYKLARGAGMQGLQGMADINTDIIRPLLNINRIEIEVYAIANAIPYRTDSSNNSDKYMRNYIRHNVLPSLQNVNKQAIQHINEAAHYVQQANAILTESVARIAPLVVIELPNYVVSINIAALQSHTQHYQAYMYYLLQPYHLTTTQHNNLLHAVNSKLSGALFKTETHLLCVYNTCVHALALNKLYVVDELIYENSTYTITNQSAQTLAIVSTNNITTANYCDENSLTFPLQLRNWQVGDTVQPLGMNGKTKLVSDLLTNKKLSILQKKQVLVVLSVNQIMCVIDSSIAHWARVVPNTKKIFSINVKLC
ncbi:MAG: tRNA lysidine(34) synthetase TilS [Bacteroidia bacterium]|nr:tRNA lysidine(34) synthetase TilS [Bacteroidia bacterium]